MYLLRFFFRCDLSVWKTKTATNEKAPSNVNTFEHRKHQPQKKENTTLVCGGILNTVKFKVPSNVPKGECHHRTKHSFQPASQSAHANILYYFTIFYYIRSGFFSHSF